MDKRIIYKNTDGGVAVIIPAENVIVSIDQKAAMQGLTAKEYLDQCYAAGMTPEQVGVSLALTVEEIAAKDVPFRNVFTQTGTEVLTQEAYDESPDHWADEGYAVGDSYPVGTWSREQHPYKIVDVADIPADRSARDLWDVDEADLTDGVGA